MSADAVTYEIVHTSQYKYAKPVSVSHHIARLKPRALPHQMCLQHTLEIAPDPAVVTSHVDYFGNVAAFFAMQGRHTALTVSAHSRVTIRPADPPPRETPPWEAAIDRASLPLDAFDCLFDTASQHPPADLGAYARASFPPGRPLREAMLDLTARIHEDFTFDPAATTVATPLEEVFNLRRGVCQDFARLEIACLRSLGLAAHYVSGYLETMSPPGTPRRIGADASHAWLAVYCPGTGWLEVDPTNNLIPSTAHVTLAWGRDYSDVSPIRGVILGGGEHSLTVSVDVVRVEAE